MRSFIIYGLINCDTTRKTIKWFKQHKVPFEFHNNRTHPLEKEKLQDWCMQVGWEKLLNKKGSAFKLLHPAIQQSATTESKAIEIMQARASTIKRPIIEKNNKVVVVGYNEIELNVRCLK